MRLDPSRGDLTTPVGLQREIGTTDLGGEDRWMNRWPNRKSEKPVG